MSSDGRARRWLGRAGAALALLLAGAGIGAALTHLLAPPRDVLAAPSFATVEARTGTVERSITLNATVARRADAPLALAGGGTVTALRIPTGAPATSGDVVATVGLRPVTLAQGDVPMFRELSPGTQGVDVEQLQRMLVAEGHLGANAVDGRYRAATTTAVKRWQAALSVPTDGVVRLQDVVFAPHLPGDVAAAEGVHVGARLGDGAALLTPLLPPDASIELPEGQAQLVVPGQAVTLESGGQTWAAVVQRVTVLASASDTRRVAELTAPGGGPVCGSDCGSVPVPAGLLVPARIQIVPPTQGVLVPASAITTDAGGRTAVVTDAGATIPVEVGASAGGEIVVAGLESGMVVRAPALLPPESGG